MAARNRVEFDLQDEAGNLYDAGVQVRWTSEAGTVMPQLYEDYANATALGNPFTVPSGTSHVAFYSPAGRYRMDVFFDGEWVNLRRDFPVGTARELDGETLLSGSRIFANLYHPDVVVNLLTERDAYDDELAPFSVLVVEDEAVYYKLSDTSADWSNPVPVVVNMSSDYATKADAEAATIPIIQEFVRIAGYYAAGDGGGAIYKRVGSEPTHAGKFQSFDGAWWEIEAADEYDVRCLGVKCDTSDDSVAWQNAIDFAQSATGRGPTLLFTGACVITDQLNITNSIRIRGTGSNFSGFYVSGGLTGIRINTPLPVILEDFGMYYQTLPPGGSTAAIVVTSPGVYNANSQFLHLEIHGAQNGIVTESAAYWKIDRCTFHTILNHGVVVQNSYQVDAGDSCISNCFFNSASANIDYKSSGGLRVINNKMIGGHWGLLMEWDGTQSLDSSTDNSSSVLIITGNSIELDADAEASIHLTRTDDSGFGVVIISGNELTAACGVKIGASGVPWCGSITITGNQWFSAANNGEGFQISSATGFLIANNFINSQGHTNVMPVHTSADSGSAIIGPNLAVGSLVASDIDSINTTTISPT